LIPTNTERNWNSSPKIQVPLLQIDYEAILKELRENFAKKDNENINKYNTLKKTEQNKEQEITALKAHLRSLLALME